MRLALVIVALCLAAPSTVLSQNTEQPDATGGWSYRWVQELDRPRLTDAEAKTMRAQLAKIAEIIHAAPMLQPPRGVHADVSARIDMGCPWSDLHCRWRVAPGWVEISLFPMYRNERGEVVRGRVDPSTITIGINDPRLATRDKGIDYQGVFDEKGNEYVYAPEEVARIGDVVVYDNNTVILARPGNPLFLPVSRELYLQTMLRQNPEEIVRKYFRDELASLSPEEKRSQAWLGNPDGSVTNTAPAGTPGAGRLVMLNPDYFDATLPRTAIQLIVLHSRWSNDNSRPPGAEYGIVAQRAYELQESLDYSPLKRLIK